MNSEVFLNFLKRTRCSCQVCMNNPNMCKEVFECKYNLYDGDGNITKTHKLFDIDESRYRYYKTSAYIPMTQLRESYEKFYSETVVSSEKTCIELDPMYRLNPIEWDSLKFLNLPPILKPGSTNTSFAEHNILGVIKQEDILFRKEYNKLILRNTKFSFFLKNLELQEAVTGFYRNPLHLYASLDWPNEWDFLNEGNSSLASWIKIANLKSFADISGFFQYFKFNLNNYILDLRLDNPRHWIRERNEAGQYIKHLQMCNKILSVGYNLAYNGITEVLQQLYAVQNDLAKVIETTVKK